ncbi:MAG TPA: undecaprenyldiphospho-muramoylpentapeptide beta-N-acetylglucosaminyltransferase [Candidatus Polarisedimenticolia bacterium]|nr:undecaprenyldiphospho-muramoylpentapeptide beta-N-acetylglucosaminyltransferase [Candidatus Polarisedimenticolia bacterium]
MTTVLVAGGGTGGHIFPGVAIARELMERLPGCEVLFVGTERGLETKIVPAAGFRLLTIRSAGITGKRVWAKVKGLALIPLSFWQSLGVIGRTRPRLVIGVGGYSSGPVLAAAILRRVPTLIHESNYVPGATNRWLAPYVSEVAVTFEESIGQLSGRGIVTGNPVRREFAHVTPRPGGAVRKNLLVFGGSQGARAINRAVCDALPALAALKGRLFVTHQTGEADLGMVAAAYKEAGFAEGDAEVRPFIGGIWEAFANADLIVSRSGATTVAELTAAGRPAILVPFAAAAHDHQTFNARKLSAGGAALLIPERELTGQRLAGAVVDLLADPDRLARMASASKSLSRPDAAARIADLCVALVSRPAPAGGR